MTQLSVWKSIAITSKNFKVIMVALRHIDLIEKKEGGMN